MNNAEDLLADEELIDLINYYNNHHQGNHHGGGGGSNQHYFVGQGSVPSSPFLQASSPQLISSTGSSLHHQQNSSSIMVEIQTGIDDQFLQQWSNYDLKKEDEMYEKYNVALKIKNNTNRETPPLLLNCRHEIHDKGNL